MGGSPPTLRQIDATRAGVAGSFAVAEEVPVAFRFGGVDYAVMMATPADIEDFATGFCVTEGIAGGVADIRDVTVTADGDGLAVDVTLTPARLRAFLADHRVRSLRGHTSCGVCGLESRSMLGATRVKMTRRPPPADAAIRRALADLRGLQPLARATHAAHAAAWSTAEGEIVRLREDVGRHNALDKLIGACLRAGHGTAEGFCLITSRCSFEMAQKAVAGGMAALVAVSAPTALAVRVAREAGLTLIALAREDGQTRFA